MPTSVPRVTRSRAPLLEDQAGEALGAGAAIRTRTLTADEFAALMVPLGPFEREPAVAVAVSGGADSLALAILAAAWAERRGGRVLALTVDHGLRPKSAAEARQTAAWLAARGIASRILAW